MRPAWRGFCLAPLNMQTQPPTLGILCKGGRAAAQQQVDNAIVAARDGLMQRRPALGTSVLVVNVGALVQQQNHTLVEASCCCSCQRSIAHLISGLHEMCMIRCDWVAVVPHISTFVAAFHSSKTPDFRHTSK